MKKLPPIKSPLRYPGGKSRALKQILPIVPEFKEFREPMVGGGSVFFALKQLFPNKKFWINDMNKELYLFWKFCKEDCDNLVKEVKKFKRRENGKEIYNELIKERKRSDFHEELRKIGWHFSEKQPNIPICNICNKPIPEALSTNEPLIKHLQECIGKRFGEFIERVRDLVSLNDLDEFDKLAGEKLI